MTRTLLENYSRTLLAYCTFSVCAEAVCLCLMQNAGASDRVRSQGALAQSARLSEKASHMLVLRHSRMTMPLERALLETVMRNFSLRSQTKVAYLPMLLQ